ncbi:unnamed protein product [Cuscuta campestris]|uniref:Uncharacterized protein n=1 Tax=Cuscuta campestris TaxID=132261 RepID=A0A484MVW6_9ASTE|nr:unnamed protein product [Cuscuta campestris]
MQQLANKREKNLVDKCLTEDSGVGVKATRIVMACLNECPAERPEAKCLLRAFEGLKGEKNGAAQKQSGLEHEASSA